jgi:hypothetical protein
MVNKKVYIPITNILSSLILLKPLLYYSFLLPYILLFKYIIKKLNFILIKCFNIMIIYNIFDFHECYY